MTARSFRSVFVFSILSDPNFYKMKISDFSPRFLKYFCRKMVLEVEILKHGPEGTQTIIALIDFKRLYQILRNFHFRMKYFYEKSKRYVHTPKDSLSLALERIISTAFPIKTFI